VPKTPFVFATSLISEAQPGVQLNDSCSHSAQKLTEESIVDAVTKAGQVRVIESVEHFCADLQPDILAQGEVLRETEVKVPHPRRPNYTYTSVARPNGRPRCGDYRDSLKRRWD